MGTVNFVATSISENSKTITEKKFRTKDQAMFYLMDLITQDIFIKTESWKLDTKSDHTWRVITDAYQSLTSFIKYQYNGTIYQLKQIHIGPRKLMIDLNEAGVLRRRADGET